jgi:hypothetical protein
MVGLADVVNWNAPKYLAGDADLFVGIMLACYLTMLFINFLTGGKTYRREMLTKYWPTRFLLTLFVAALLLLSAFAIGGRWVQGV